MNYGSATVQSSQSECAPPLRKRRQTSLLARGLGGVVLIALAAFFGLAPKDADAKVLTGRARVVDGDGLIVAGQEIRLQGIAAPEWNEPGGREAAAALKAIISGKTVACFPDGTRSYDRIVAICAVDGIDVGSLLVAAGHALDCPRYSRGRYAREEAQARRAGRDLRRIYRLPGYCRP